MIRIRKANLQDYLQIWQIHASDIADWVDETGEVDEAKFRQASMAERWRIGGPWMSPETCAIHLNALLLAGQIPLVASKGQRVLGELELFVGPDARAGGKNANISVLYAHRVARGQRIGSALLHETVRRARVLDCQSITVFNPSAEAERLYQRFGLTEELHQQQLHLPCQSGPRPAGVELTIVPLPDHAQLGDIPLWVGYYQSSVQCWQHVAWSLAPGIYALALKPIRPEMIVQLRLSGGETALLVFRPLGDGSVAMLHIWTRTPQDAFVRAAISYGAELGFKQLELMVDQAAAQRLHRRFGGQILPGYKRLLCHL